MQAKMEKAIAYTLAHPDASKEQAAKDTGLSTSSIARARKFLVDKGLIPGSRKIPPRPYPTVDLFPDMKRQDAPPTPAVQDPPAPAAPGLLDHQALIAMATGIEADLSDDEVQRRLMRQAQLFAFNPALHPDTRMSASTLWAKLRDMRKDDQIGPRAPLTFADAVSRAKDFSLAAGRAVMAVAIQEAFYANGTADVEAAAAVGTAEAPGPAGHDGPAPAPEDLRQLDLGVRREGPGEGLEHQDPPRPEA